MATDKPSQARLSAMPRPRPRLAPVTRTTGIEARGTAGGYQLFASGGEDFLDAVWDGFDLRVRQVARASVFFRDNLDQLHQRLGRFLEPAARVEFELAVKVV